jgi:regulator of protease activity HflC (stomatin/prohibitin superfamily)
MHRDAGNDQLKNKRFRLGKAGRADLIQNIITKDNVSINIDAAVYYRVVNPRYAYYRVQNFNIAISEVTYAILKNTCGQFILQDLLEKRQEIADDIEKQVDQYVMEWGVDVTDDRSRSKKYSLRTSS